LIERRIAPNSTLSSCLKPMLQVVLSKMNPKSPVVNIMSIAVRCIYLQPEGYEHLEHELMFQKLDSRLGSVIPRNPCKSTCSPRWLGIPRLTYDC
jgi:hypothetical protein